MTAGLRIEESEGIEIWLTNIETQTSEIAVATAEELGDLVKKDAIAQLKHIEREGALPVKRSLHTYQDVKKTHSKKYGYVAVGGGGLTGTLWHIINDGTYRSRATHFIDAILANLDGNADKVFDKISDRLGLK